MTTPLDGFDPQRTYDDAALDYEDASSEFWQYVPLRSVERLVLRDRERVLDAPCGTGPALVAAARVVGPSGRVVGVDYAPQMVALAQERARGLDHVEVRVGDMLAIESAEPFDAVNCALGVFFVDDMPGLVQSLLDLARPDTGRLMVSVFGEAFFEPMRSVFVDAVADIAPSAQVVEPWRRTEDESTLRSLFAADVAITTDDDLLPLRAASDWWRIVMGSGLRSTVGKLADEAASEVRRRCEDYIATHRVRELRSTTRYALASSFSNARVR